MSKAKQRSGDESKGLEGITDALVHRIPMPILILLTILVVLVLWAALGPRPASAQEDARWAYNVIWRQHCNDWGDCYRRRERIRYYRPPVYGYERRLERDREEVSVRGHCLWNNPVVSATGDDKLEEEKARVSAQDRWSLTVENLRGTRYSDIRNAADLTAACIKRAPVTWTERQQANLGDVRHFVCTIEAIPCSAPKIPIEEDELAKRKVEKINEQIGRKDDPQNGYYDPPPKKRWLERWRKVRQ